MSADFTSLDFSGASAIDFSTDSGPTWPTWSTTERASDWLDALKGTAAGAFSAAKDVLQFQLMSDQLVAQRDARDLARQRQQLDAQIAARRAQADAGRQLREIMGAPAAAGLSTGALLAIGVVALLLLRGRA